MMAAAAADDDDDLAAFFDDVENAVQEAAKDDDDDDDDEQNERPSKRVKSETAATTETTNHQQHQQQQPAVVKVVAASSVPVISILPSFDQSYTSALASPNAANTASIHARGGLPTNNNIAASASGIPQLQQQQLQPPTPMPTNNVHNNQANNNNHHSDNPQHQHDPHRTHIRSAAGETWVDPTLTQWPSNDFRLFIGNLAKDLKQSHLENAFSIYPSFHMARIMYDKSTGKSRGYGFVSLLDPKDCARAIREKDQSWLGSRPIKVKLSEWKDREWKEVVKKEKNKKNSSKFAKR